ncbi:MAG: HAMP domain-containing histidine kinase [Clostridiales bacterium]|nr:HAMP domain-containing histidine kinase [Clostridiales bacterium]
MNILLKIKRMKKLWLLPIAVAVYIAGLTGGVCTLSYARIQDQHEELKLQSHAIGSYLLYSYLPISSYDLSISETTAVIFNPDGDCLAYLTSAINSDLKYDFRDRATSYFVNDYNMAANDYHTATTRQHIYIRDTNSIFIVYTHVIRGNRLEANGMVCLFARLTSLPYTLKLYTLTYSLIFIMIAIVFVFNEWKNRQVTQLQQTYVSNISHDLKSPIASIKALTEALSEDMVTDPTTRAQYYGTILREANRLERSVRDMLELSKVQSIALYEKSRIPAADIFSDTLEKYAVLCDELSIHFQSDASIQLLPPLLTNKEACACILDILLNNAVKFVDIGGNISFSVNRHAGSYVFCVKDDGIGIPQEDQERIFQRFYKGNPERNKNGSGLGLSIAQEMCSRMNERIWVESKPGEGTRFYFTIRAK